MYSPGTIWITGLSASGKSSLGRALASGLSDAAVPGVVVLDGDEFRARLDRKYGHTLQDRVAVLGHLVEAARAENMAGRAVIVMTISHKRAMRAHARRRIGHFMEVYLDCPVEVCSARDPNGLYRRALAGEYSCFPGVTEEYERSEDPEVVLDTAALSAESAARRLLPAALAFLGASDRAEIPGSERNAEWKRRRVAELRARPPLGDGDAPEWSARYSNISLRVREKCAQLFYVYAGVGGLPGMNGLRFLHEAKLVDRNLALIRDPYNEDFMCGIGDGIDDIESLLDWHGTCQRHLPHVSEIYCVGNSMGAYAAVLFAHLLGARAAWAFGLRPVGAWPMVRALCQTLEADAGSTVYHLYFSMHDPDDRRMAEIMAPCRGVRLHPLEEVPLEKSHQVMVSLADRGRLRDMFPPFRGAPAPEERLTLAQAIPSRSGRPGDDRL
jgi:adenylylsulfate kinase